MLKCVRKKLWAVPSESELVFLTPAASWRKYHVVPLRWPCCHSHDLGELGRQVELEDLVVEALVLAEFLEESGVEVAAEGEHGLLGEHAGYVHREDQGGWLSLEGGVPAHFRVEGGVVQLHHGSEVCPEASKVPEVAELEHQRSSEHASWGSLRMVVEHRLELADTLLEGGGDASLATVQCLSHLVIDERMVSHQHQ